MLSVQLRIRGDHLRLKPDTKLHSQSIDLIHQRLQATRQFLLIGFPVAQTGAVIIAVSEPAVIHDQHLNAEL